MPASQNKFFITFPLILVLMLIGGEAGRLAGFDVGQAWASAEEKEEDEGGVLDAEPEYIRLDPISVPIRGKRKISHYVFLSLSLEVANSGETDRVQRYRPKLRDAFIRDLNGKTVLSKAGDGTLDFDAIKKRLIRRAEKILGKGIVTDVLIINAISGFG